MNQRKKNLFKRQIWIEASNRKGMEVMKEVISRLALSCVLVGFLFFSACQSTPIELVNHQYLGTNSLYPAAYGAMKTVLGKSVNFTEIDLVKNELTIQDFEFKEPGYDYVPGELQRKIDLTLTSSEGRLIAKVDNPRLWFPTAIPLVWYWRPYPVGATTADNDNTLIRLRNRLNDTMAAILVDEASYGKAREACLSDWDFLSVTMRDTENMASGTFVRDLQSNKPVRISLVVQSVNVNEQKIEGNIYKYVVAASDTPSAKKGTRHNFLYFTNDDAAADLKVGSSVTRFIRIVAANLGEHNELVLMLVPPRSQN